MVSNDHKTTMQNEMVKGIVVKYQFLFKSIVAIEMEGKMWVDKQFLTA